MDNRAKQNALTRNNKISIIAKVNEHTGTFAYHM
jgi:hypothetical protein